MATQTIKNITLPSTLIRRKQGIAILPLEEYERMKEDLEMFHSKKLAKDVEKARREAKEGKIITLKEIEKELNL